MVVSALERLCVMKEKGHLTDEEFKQAKGMVLGGVRNKEEEEEEEVERISKREPSGQNDEEIHTCVLDKLKKFKEEHPQIKLKEVGKIGAAHFTIIWNTEQEWKRLILENHQMDYRTKPGLLTSITLEQSRKLGECNPGNWMKEFQWEKWGKSMTRTFFDPAGHTVEEVQEILNKLL